MRETFGRGRGRRDRRDMYRTEIVKGGSKSGVGCCRHDFHGEQPTGPLRSYLSGKRASEFQRSGGSLVVIVAVCECGSREAAGCCIRVRSKSGPNKHAI